MIKLFTLVTILFVGSTICQRDPRNDCDERSCGVKGVCVVKPTSKRCSCTKGWMGKYCQRPCQDTYKSCERWAIEGRCSWENIFKTPFFNTNCAQTCNVCEYDADNYLPTPLHPLLESASWLVGAWETTTQFNDHFPSKIKTPGGYKQRMEIKVNNVPMFDRPPLNISSVATSLANADDVHSEMGYITCKIALEDTGFDQNSSDKFDKIAIELNSNMGVNTVEEGKIEGTKVSIDIKFRYAMVGQEQYLPTESNRRFELVGNDRVKETTSITYRDGSVSQYSKTFTRVLDYLKPSLYS